MEVDSDQVAALAEDLAGVISIAAGAQGEGAAVLAQDSLARLDELKAALDATSEEALGSLEKDLPALRAKCRDLQALYAKIDTAERFVKVVSRNMGEMEEVLSSAEAAQSQRSRDMFKRKVFFFNKKPQMEETVKVVVPEVYNTDDYFGATTTPEETPTLTAPTCLSQWP